MLQIQKWSEFKMNLINYYYICIQMQTGQESYLA